MPGFLTEFVNNQILDCLFGGRAIDPPSTLYFGLSLTRGFKGGYIVEPIGGSYARVAVPNNLEQFVAASSGMKSNAFPVVFPTPTGDWGSARSVFIADAASGGNVLAMADLPSARSINRGDVAPTVAANALFLFHS